MLVARKPKVERPTLIGPAFPYISMRLLADDLNLISGGASVWDSTKMLRHLRRKDGCVFRLDPEVPRPGKGNAGPRKQKSEVTRSAWVTTVERLHQYYPEIYQIIAAHLSREERERLTEALGANEEDEDADA